MITQTHRVGSDSKIRNENFTRPRILDKPENPK